MATVKVRHYRRRDGSRVKPHKRRLKEQSAQSSLKKLRNHFRGKLRSASRRQDSKDTLQWLKSRVKYMSQAVNAVKRDNRAARQHRIRRKRRGTP